MNALPSSVKDALLLVTVLGMIVSVAFQVKQNNLVAHRQHQSCVTRIALAKQGNKAASERSDLERAVRIFVSQTRRVRSNPHGTSYDPGFVSVIDRRVQPLLDHIRPFTVPVPPPC